MKHFLAVAWSIAVLLTLCSCGSEIPETAETERQFPPATELPTEMTTEPPKEPTEPEIAATEPEAVRLREGVRIQVNGNDQSNVLCDDNHYTKKQITPNHTLKIVSREAFSAVYVEWDRVPGTYSLVWEDGSEECGENGFLHEYIRLPESVNELTFAFEGEAYQMVCEVGVFTSGTAPEGVQDWLAPCGQADILAFPTHSDDDVLFFGPVISYYAIEKDLTVQTAFMVDHAWQRERAHERLNGLWEMGVRHYPILWNAPDTGEHDMAWGMNYYSRFDVLGWQVEQIRRFQPLVILSHDLDGEYGNAGHKVNAYYLTQAVAAAPDPEQYPETAARFGVWDTPKMYIHLYEENQWYFDVNTPMEADPAGRTPFEVAEDALKYHVSQIQGGLHMFQSDNAPEWDCRPFGLYRSLVGADSTADVMEHIDPGQWRQHILNN